MSYCCYPFSHNHSYSEKKFFSSLWKLSSPTFLPSWWASWGWSCFITLYVRDGWFNFEQEERKVLLCANWKAMEVVYLYISLHLMLLSLCWDFKYKSMWLVVWSRCMHGGCICNHLCLATNESWSLQFMDAISHLLYNVFCLKTQQFLPVLTTSHKSPSPSWTTRIETNLTS